MEVWNLLGISKLYLTQSNTTGASYVKCIGSLDFYSKYPEGGYKYLCVFVIETSPLKKNNWKKKYAKVSFTAPPDTFMVNQIVICIWVIFHFFFFLKFSSPFSSEADHAIGDSWAFHSDFGKLLDFQLYALEFLGFAFWCIILK